MNNFHSQEYSTFILLLDCIVFNIFINDEVNFIQFSYGEHNSVWILSSDNRLKSLKNKIMYIFGKGWLNLNVALEITAYYWA